MALAAVAGAVAAFCLYRQVNSVIRRRVETRIAQQYPGLKVGVRSAELVEGKGIRIHDLSIAEPGIEGADAELLHVEEVMVECPTDWKKLIEGDPPVSRVMVRRPTLRVSRRPDGAWSAGRLLPPPRFGDHPPEVTVEHGAIVIVDSRRSSGGALELRDLNLTLVPAPAAAPSEQRHVRQLQGTLAGDGLRLVTFEGWLDVYTSACSIRGKAEGVEVSPELRDRLPEPLATKLAVLGGLRGQAEFGFQVDSDQVSPPRFSMSARFSRGQIDDPRLPRTLTDISAGVRLNNAGYAIDDLTARSGQTTLRMSCRQTGLEPTSPLELTAQMRQLELDPALLRVLPPVLQEQWRKYSPAGQIDADVRLDYDGRSWRPQVLVNCLNVSFAHYKFPYRFDHATGKLELKNDGLKLNLTAYSGRQPVTMTADVGDPFSQNPPGRFEASGGDLQIDEALMAALPEKSQEVVRSLDPRGAVAFYLCMWRARSEEPMHEHLVLDVDRCSIRYDKFPYLLTSVCGRLEMLDHEWTFQHLVGTHNTARVACEGNLTPGLQGPELVLKFKGDNVPLEDELRDALSARNPHIQQVWLDTRPHGIVDLTADVHYLIEEKKFSVGVHVRPQRDATSIEPVRFPYRLDRVQGDIDYRDGHVDFRNCKAEHGPATMPVKIAADGCCDFQRDGRWQVHFEKLTVDQLRADRELNQALPERLKKAMAELNPTGAMNLRGSFNLERMGLPTEPLRSQWNMRVGMQQGSLQCGGILLENVCGEATFRGACDGQHLQSRGELALDSVSYRDCQFARVMGPIWIDDGRVLLGEWVDRREGGAVASEATGPMQQPRRLTADLFGGKLYGDGWVTLGRTPQYAMNVALTDASLARCAQEVMAGRQKLRGKILATARLTGSGRTCNLLSGDGVIQLSEADVYELPVMVSLLKILSVRPPDQNAFSDGTIAYRIVGEHIYFDRIVFHGDAISLRGAGHMDLQSQIQLTFYCLVGRGELEIPIVKQVVRSASQQLMLMHVDGTLQNPHTSRETLPAVNQALQQLRGELEERR